MGTAITVRSRFFSTDQHGVTRALTFVQLWANWRDWFDHGYRIPANAVAAQVRRHGTVVQGPVRVREDYDLDHDARPVDRRGDIIRAMADAAEAVARLEKSKKSVRTNNQRARQQHLHGINNRIDMAKSGAAALIQLYPSYWDLALGAARAALKT